MSKITNYGLTRSGTGCFKTYSCIYMATVGVKGLIRPWIDTSILKCATIGSCRCLLASCRARRQFRSRWVGFSLRTSLVQSRHRAATSRHSSTPSRHDESRSFTAVKVIESSAWPSSRPAVCSVLLTHRNSRRRDAASKTSLSLHCSELPCSMQLFGHNFNIHTCLLQYLHRDRKKTAPLNKML